MSTDERDDYSLPELDMPEAHSAWFVKNGWKPRQEPDSGETFAPNFTKLSPTGIRHSLYWDGRRAYDRDKPVYQLESAIPSKHDRGGYRTVHSDHDMIFESHDPQAIVDKAKQNEQAWMTGEHNSVRNPGLMRFMDDPGHGEYDKRFHVEPTDESPAGTIGTKEFTEPKEQLHPLWRGGPGGRSGLGKLNSTIPDETGLKAAGIAVIAMDTGRVLMQQRALNPLHCPCGMGVTWDEMNGYQHSDGSVSHDDTDMSVSEMLDQGHDEEKPLCPCCLGRGDDENGGECISCDGTGKDQQEPQCDPPCNEIDQLLDKEASSDGWGLDKTGALEFDPNEGTWEFPGGKMDEGESPRDAAIREFREEVGQDLPPGVFVGAWVSPGGIVVHAAKGWVDPAYQKEFYDYARREVGYEPHEIEADPALKRELADGFGHYIGEDHPKDARYHLDTGGAGYQKVRTGTPGATVRVLRIEKPDGTGPFAYGPGDSDSTIPRAFEADHPDNLYSLLNPYAEDDPDRGSMRQRQPYADGIPARYVRGRVFGFLPQHNVNDYFTPRMLRGLHDHGYGMSQYDVPGESIVHGRTQTAWRPQDATLVSHKPLTEHFPGLTKQASFQLPKPPVYRHLHDVDPRALDDEHANDAYKAMAHDPYDSVVQHAYDALEHETIGQLNDLHSAGLHVQYHDGGNDYPNSKAMTEDVARGHLWTRHSEGDGLPADHPMSRVVGKTIVHTPEGPVQKALTLNDVFRAVHDVNGHTAGVGHEVVGFGPKGEFNAWLRHRTTYSDAALPALWNETRGQAAQLGPMTKAGVPLAEIPFVEQKAGRVPQHLAREVSDGWCVTPGRVPDDMTYTAANPEPWEHIPSRGSSPRKGWDQDTDLLWMRSEPAFERSRRGDPMKGTHPESDVSYHDFRVPAPDEQWVEGYHTDITDEPYHSQPLGGMEKLNAVSGPVYKGFIYLIQKESDIDLGNREIANPDDPDGDMSEQSAWWDIEHAKENPALRQEVKQTPWDELELWADKSVRTNKATKEAIASMALPASDHVSHVGETLHPGETGLTVQAAGKCSYCKSPATKEIKHSEGMGLISVCDKHLSKGKTDAENCTPDGTKDPSNIDWIHEATSGRMFGVSTPAFDRMKNSIYQNRPEYRLRTDAEIPEEHHYSILSNDVPAYHEEKQYQPGSPKIYGLRSGLRHTFLAPVVHNETGERGWLRGGDYKPVENWTFYGEDQLDNAMRGTRPDFVPREKGAPSPAELRYKRQRATGRPVSSPTKSDWQEGDRVLDEEGHQVVPRRSDKFGPAGHVRGWADDRSEFRLGSSDKPWWEYE